MVYSTMLKHIWHFLSVLCRHYCIHNPRENQSVKESGVRAFVRGRFTIRPAHFAWVSLLKRYKLAISGIWLWIEHTCYVILQRRSHEQNTVTQVKHPSFIFSVVSSIKVSLAGMYVFGCGMVLTFAVFLQTTDNCYLPRPHMSSLL